METKLARPPFDLKLFEQLAPRWQGRTFYFPVINSTNEEARRKLRQDALQPRELLLVTDEQTAGRGRLGRSWQAPASSGLLFTLAFPLAPLSLDRAFLYTASLALSIVGASGQLQREARVQLKWPNDLLRGGKKTGGILAEVENNLGRARNEKWLVLGCGLNINLTDEDLKGANLSEKATNLTPQPVAREQLLAVTLENFEQYRVLLATKPDKVRQEWATSLVTLGQEVHVLNGAEPLMLAGRATAVTEDGALVIEDRTGKQHQVQAGDVSIRLPDGRYSA